MALIALGAMRAVGASPARAVGFRRRKSTRQDMGDHRRRLEIREAPGRPATPVRRPRRRAVCRSFEEVLSQRGKHQAASGRGRDGSTDKVRDRQLAGPLGCGASDTVYIFFSGHGLVEREFGESYLMAADSDARDPYGTAVSVSELGHALSRRVRAGRVFIIADAVRRDLFPESEAGAADQFVQAFNRLASIRDGLSAMLASGPGEFSREGRAWGGHGVFTKQLLDALSGGADSDRDGAITADEVFSFVSSRVAQETSNKQHPWQSEARLAQLVLSRTAVQPVATVKSSERATRCGIRSRMMLLKRKSLRRHPRRP